MSKIPNELKYTASHEWLREDDGTVTIGITDNAQSLLGDLVFVDLPEVGAQLTAGGDAGVVESVKAASDIYSPVTGEVVEVNEALNDSPEQINRDPYGEGWLFRLKLSDNTELDKLLDAKAYTAQVEEGESH